VSVRRSTPRIGLAVALSASVWLGCNFKGDTAPSPSASALPKTPDRLAPDELEEGQTHLFGLKLPASMRVEARFLDSGHATGPIAPEKLANFVRKRVEVRHVELAASRTVFAKARIKGGDPSKHYRIEVIPKGRETKLFVELSNPPKPPAPQGISEAERWKRAGLTPDGKMINPQELE
jgi:hypothetical protein